MNTVEENGRLRLDHPGEIVFRLGLVLEQAMVKLACERRHPGGNPDSSDDLIRDLEHKVAVLRRIRGEFEDVMSGVATPAVPAPAVTPLEEIPGAALLALRDEAVKHMKVLASVVRGTMSVDSMTVADALAFVERLR